MKFSEKFKKIISGSLLAAFIAALLLLAYFAGIPMIRFVSDTETFHSWVSQNYILSRIAFVLMMCFQIVVAIIPGEPLEIGAGYAFGVFQGTALCMAGSLLGSMIIFALVRFIGLQMVYLFFSQEQLDKIKFLQNTEKLNYWVFIIFFIPGTPKDLLSYFIGLTKMKALTWMFISTAARIPSIITSTAGGNAIGSKNYLAALAIFVLTSALSLAGLYIYNKIINSNNNGGKNGIDEIF